MIEFLKYLLKNANFKTNNKKLNKFIKILYGFIILLAICFIIFILYYLIIHFSSITDNMKDTWNNSKYILNVKK